jgi:hypothetical protein
MMVHVTERRALRADDDDLIRVGRDELRRG